MGAVLLFLIFWTVIFAVYLIIQPSPVNKTKQLFAKSVTWTREMIGDPGEAARVLAIAGITIALLGFAWLYVLNRKNNFVSDFYANVATELLSIAITVLIIDRLYARRSANEEKQRIIRQLASRSNEFALEAVRLCSEDGRKWLRDGSIQGAILWDANLQDARLTGANLEGAELWNANLQGAKLDSANLEGAELYRANLQGAELMLANFQGADLMDAALEDANLEGANLKSVHYNTSTVWPNGFDPKAAGALNWHKMNEDEKEQWYVKWDQ